MGHCSYVPIDVVLVLLTFFFLVFGFSSFLTYQNTKKRLLSTLHQCLIIVSIVIILHFVGGFSLSFGRDMFLGIVSDFSESIFLIDWDVCDEITRRSTILKMGIEAGKASISIFIILSAVIGKMKPLHTVILLFTWYFIIYIPLVSWIRNPSGWIHTLFKVEDFSGTLITHGLSGCFALGLSLFFPERNGSECEHRNSLEGYPNSSTELIQLKKKDEFASNGINQVERLSLSQKVKQRCKDLKKYLYGGNGVNISQHRIRPNDPVLMSLGAWTTFLALLVVTVSSHNTDDRSIILSLVNSVLCSLISALIFYFLFKSFKKASLANYSYGLITGTISCSAFAGVTAPLYALPIGVFISCVGLTFVYVSDKLPRFRPLIFPFAINGVTGVLSSIAMGFMKQVPYLNVVASSKIGALEGIIQFLIVVVTVMLALVLGFMFGFLFRYVLGAEIPSHFHEKGLDYLYTYEQGIDKDAEYESGTESEYETYTESVYVRFGQNLPLGEELDKI